MDQSTLAYEGLTESSLVAFGFPVRNRDMMEKIEYYHQYGLIILNFDINDLYSRIKTDKWC
jgi:hypothetical protein